MAFDVMSKRDLDKAGCGMAFCDHDHSVLWIHQRCHPHSDVEVKYEKATSQVVVQCKRCKAEVVRLKVTD